MHDPMTVAFEIGWPWTRALRAWRRRKDRLRRIASGVDQDKAALLAFGWAEPAVTIWHRDAGGRDGACAWSWARPTERQMQALRSLAWEEARDPWFMRSETEAWRGVWCEAEGRLRVLVLKVAACLRLKVSADEATRLVCELPEWTRFLCFKPGWHTVSEQDTPAGREQVFLEHVRNVASVMLTERRPWYRHPRWHVWHWRLQVPVVQRLLRWTLDRCEKCGGRFRWGESAHTNQWDLGPRTLRRPRIHGLLHSRCSGVAVVPDEAVNERAL